MARSNHHHAVGATVAAATITVLLVAGCGGGRHVSSTTVVTTSTSSTPASVSTTAQLTASSTTSPHAAPGSSTAPSTAVLVTTSALVARGQIQGTVTVSSGCGGPPPPNGGPCPTSLSPLGGAQIEARPVAGGLSSKTKSGADGRYAFSLGVGSYDLITTAGPPTSCATVRVTVNAGSVTHADITCARPTP